MAGRLNWRRLDKPHLGLMNSVSDLIGEREIKGYELTAVRRGPTLVLASDYGGEHKSARYEILSFLLADLAYCWFWDDIRKELRSRFLRDGRRLSFKSLNDKMRQAAIVPFLRAANSIPGLSATILVDKRIPSLFHKDKIDMGSPEYTGHEHWKGRSFEKLLRVAHFGAMIVACMPAPGQDLTWFTDEDEIAPNEERVVEATEIAAHILAHYLPHSLRHFRFGTTKCDDGSLMIEDLAALPDLVAGALSDVFTTARHQGVMPRRGVLVPLADGLSRKTQGLVDWFADSTQTLKRLIVVLESDGQGGIVKRCVDFHADSSSPRFMWAGDLLKRVYR